MSASLTPHRALLALLLATIVLGVSMVPRPAPAAAGGLCSVPIIGAVCSAVSGLTDGVSWTVNTGTGAIANAAGKVIGTVTNKLGTLGCVAAADAGTDGIAVPVAARICAAAVSKLTSLLTKKKNPTSTTTAPVGGTTAATDPPDAPNHYLRTSVMAAGAGLAIGLVGHLISKGTTADVTAGWFGSLYGRMVAFMAGLAALAFLLAIGEGVATGNTQILLTAVKSVPSSFIMAAAATTIVAAGIAITDQAGVQIAGPNLSSAHHLLTFLGLALAALGLAAKAAASHGHSTFAAIGAFPATIFVLWGVIAGFAVLVELFLREVGIYAATLLLPLALAARIWPQLRGATVKLIETLIAIIASKLVMVVMFALAAGAALGGGISGLAVGLGVMTIAAIVPFVFYRLLQGLTDHHFTAGQVTPPILMAGSAAGRVSSVMATNSARMPPEPPAYRAASSPTSTAAESPAPVASARSAATTEMPVTPPPAPADTQEWLPPPPDPKE